jgi:arylsulfatase A-like enzyme
VAALAQEALTALELGKDETTDLLALSFSQVDAVGHDYGPRSREQLENLLHLDRVLGEFLGSLDRVVGEGSWLLALTGDHGVMDVPESMREEGRAGTRASESQLDQLRAIFLRSRDWHDSPLVAEDALVNELEALPFVADALGLSDLTGGPPADSFVVLMRNSHHPDRWTGGFDSQGSGVVFRFSEGFYATSDPQGTGHGSPYYHDRWVPLYFLGAGVRPGTSASPVRTVDVAPTLADLAGISMPTDLDGRPVFE